MKMPLPTRNASVTLSLLIVVLFGSSTYLSAWGPGHDDVNRIALDRLPADIKALLSPDDRKAFVKESHAPDDFTPWAEYERRKERALTPNDLATLASHNIKTPYAASTEFPAFGGPHLCRHILSRYQV